MKRHPFLTFLLLLSGAAPAQPADLTWTHATPAGAAPSPRIDAPIAYDAAGKQLILFGGLDASGDRNDLWSYSLDRQQWTQLTAAGTPPAARHGHTVTYDPIRRRVIVIAGQGSGFFNDVFAYEIAGNRWTPLASSGPAPRYGHSAIYDSKRDRIVISHGFTFEGRFDDTWALDLSTSKWTDISPAGTRPLRRCLHHAGYVPDTDQMLIYGGCSSGFGPCPQGDLWSFDLAANTWKQITSSPEPPARQRYGMVFDDLRRKLVVFAGLGGPALSDTWEFDPATQAWTQIAPTGDPQAARYRHEAVFASDLGVAFFFGGQTSSYTNDVLVLSPAASSAKPVVTAVRDVFSGGAQPFAPGQIVSIYGTGLSPANNTTASFDPVTNTLPLALAGVSVTVGGIPAPLYFVSQTQVNLQIPYELDGKSQAALSVRFNQAESDALSIALAAVAPRLYPGVFNQDGSVNGPGTPAATGDIVTLYASGQGVTNPPIASGKSATAPYPTPVAPIRVTVGGRDAEVLFAGLAPGTAGLLQVNVRIPGGVPTGDALPITLLAGSIPAQTGITVAIH